MGSTNDHALTFMRPRDENDYCCKSYRYGAENQPRKNDDLHCEWNDRKWPRGTLAIHWIDDVKVAGQLAIASGLGYETKQENLEGGRHYMAITDDAGPWDVAHELGHILGMSHEFVRWDRDDHVEFRCRNLHGMQDAVNAMMLKEPWLTNTDRSWQSLCTDRYVAIKYKAPSVNYVIGDGLDPKEKPQLDGPEGFDIDSIMMYASTYDSIVGAANVDPRTAVLVGIKKDNNGKKIPGSEFMIPEAKKPSLLDAAFVKKFYPWDQARWEQ